MILNQGIKLTAQFEKRGKKQDVRGFKPAALVCAGIIPVIIGTLYSL
ncbi:MAG: hypothetical protein NC120_09125 [Ruminococcus sp.]|nr:hypothetical protein [Ruminococcus sp.]